MGDRSQSLVVGRAVEGERADEHGENVRENADVPPARLDDRLLPALLVELENAGRRPALVARAEGVAPRAPGWLFLGTRAQAVRRVLHGLLVLAAGDVERDLARKAAHTEHAELVALFPVASVLVEGGAAQAGAQAVHHRGLGIEPECVVDWVRPMRRMRQ
eukprot:CAMPEP_0168421494 /NCGR_PEP_ID=MMETSP0228-20121227/33310_1 /TAXON_ID=133427 /ORGANISM="Protoceratium reticulatum, Strain CCCM 535 (=CCMP 1889)" /LENGTH=160 /DNA_ID=CAMNT_0008435403 /DNA_START=1312 /DNA_END=1794 /DNA_ORIENTATION=+